MTVTELGQSGDAAVSRDPAAYRPWSRVPGAERARIAQAVREEYGLICWLCNSPIPGSQTGPGSRFSVDHIIPDSFGGGHELENLRPAHVSCNSARGARKRIHIPYLGPRRSWTED